MIKSSNKLLLEKRIARLEKMIKNESADLAINELFDAVINKLAKNGFDITDQNGNTLLVSMRPDVISDPNDITDEGFIELAITNSSAAAVSCTISMYDFDGGSGAPELIDDETITVRLDDIDKSANKLVRLIVMFIDEADDLA